MKSYTDIEQSKKLAEILPLESADGFWEFHTYWGSDGDEWEGYEDYPNAVPYLKYTRMENEWKEEKQDMPCWSLAALLNVIGNIFKYSLDYNGTSFTLIVGDFEITNETTVDACYEMILKLHEFNLL